MAKRKKSKKTPTSEKVAQAPAPEANENAASPETAAESQTVNPSLAEAPSPAVVVEGPVAEANTDPPVSDEGAAEATEPAPAEAAEGEAADAGMDAGGDAAQSVSPEETAAQDGMPADGIPAEGMPADTSTMPAGTEAALATTETVEGEEAPSESKLESIVESLLFASDKPLGLAEIKRLLGERDGKKVTAALASLTERRKGTGIEVAALSSGWHLRTNPENADWVSKLLVGRPVRLSRATLETLAIVAYRQPVTRPEVDDIRGVDCGPVLKTLLDRGLVRIIGKKEEVGRPMLYGTTPEFLRIFNLRDLSELPTLREFYDLSTEDQSRVEAEHGPGPEPQSPSATTPKPDVALTSVMRGALQPEPEDTDPLLDELDEASQLAKQALGGIEPAPDEGEASGGEEGAGGPQAPERRVQSEDLKSESDGKTDEAPPSSPQPVGE